MTPGVSILLQVRTLFLLHVDACNLRLALEIFHNIKKPVVDIRLVHKAYLHLIKVAKGILMSRHTY